MRLPRPWPRLFWRSLKRLTPTSLFGRSLLIIVLPVALMQIAVTYVFFDAHWQTVNSHLTEGLAGDVALILQSYEEDPSPASLKRLEDRAQRLVPKHQEGERLSIAETVCEAMAHAARDLDLRAIVAFTDSAATARMLSKYRPGPRIYAFTPHEAVCNRMNLLWGVTPVRCPGGLTVLRMGEFAEAELKRLQVIEDGDVFGLIAGTSQSAGATNFLRLMIAGLAKTSA